MEVCGVLVGFKIGYAAVFLEKVFYVKFRKKLEVLGCKTKTQTHGRTYKSVE
jgi:hypothetical protein